MTGRGSIVSALAAVSLAIVPLQPVFARDLTDSAIEVRDAALNDDLAWDVVESLTTEVGARPLGSPAMDRARDWAVAKFKELGFVNIKVETFRTPAWLRVGKDSGRVVSPYPHELNILALGNSAPTPQGGLTGQVALFRSFQELLAQPGGSLSGKIAVVTQPMVRTQDVAGYSAGFAQRSGAEEAAKRGAIAYLTHSLTASEANLPHTGVGTVGNIPAAALTGPDAELLELLVRKGQPVMLHLEMNSAVNPQAPAYNISGDLPGTSDEVVVLGGHLDSWDQGTGAQDDAAGIGVSLAAAKLATRGNAKPRRTIRVVMWGSEEQRGSNEAYAAAHRDEAGRMALISESDTGSDRVYEARLPIGSGDHPSMRAFKAALAPLGVIVSRQPGSLGGADIAQMVAAGVPTVDFMQDLTRYMDVHHSADDTIDKIDRAQLRQVVAVWASFLHSVAYSDVNFRELAVAAKSSSAQVAPKSN